MQDNPLLLPWETPFGVPPFDLIRPEHFPPAFDQSMAQHRAEVAAIAADPAPPSFANTLAALEGAGRLLGRVASCFFNLVSSLSSDALQAVERDYAPRLARHRAEMTLDPAIFARIGALHAAREGLDLAADERRLLERTHAGLVRAGAGLEPEARARLTELSTRLATLHTAFGQNVLQDETEWHMPLAEDELDGLPGFARDAARQAAVERALQGYVITLSRSSVEPFLTFSTRRELRERAWRAWVARGTSPGARDNRPLIREILALRAERARLLGHADFARWRLADNMAREPEAVDRLLRQVWAPATRQLEAERAELEKLAGEAGHNEPLQAWDWRHWAERACRALHDFDESLVKPYFPLEGMLRAAFATAGKLFGVTFTERHDISLYHPDVRAFEMLGADGRHRGLFLLDSFARAGKRSGAWMSSYRVAESFAGVVTPIIVNNNNIAKATPALLSFDEARTLFHEFGHALHGLLSTARYPSQSGTNVLADFVEFPSQVLEHWLTVPETLREHARHHESGEPLPEALLQRLLASRNFGQGFATVEFVSSALIDLALHTHADPAGLDIDTVEAEFLAQIEMPAAMVLRHRPTHFQHLFAGGGYAAGYYTYMWAEVLDADAFDAFEAAGDAFDPVLSAGLRDIYEAGDTRDPMELYRAFRGRDPEVTPLLRKRGLLGGAA